MRTMAEHFFDDSERVSEEKIAFNINIDPGSIVGAVTGAAVANKVTKNQLRQQQQKADAGSIFSGSYYSQVENLASNLRVIFTPLSVLYTVKNGPKEITIETINTEEMTPDMYQAWKSKDYLYYKNLLLNKVSSDIQFVEQQFAKNVIDRHIKLQNQISKKATYIPDSISIFETADYMDGIRKIYESDNESQKNSQFKNDTIEKTAAVIFGNHDTGTKVALELPRPFSDYHDVSASLDFLKFAAFDGGIKSLQGKFLKPGYLQSRLNVGFFPDRIIYAVDNRAVTTLMAYDMNNEAFEAFEQKDSDYFKDLFKTETRLGLKRMKAKEKKNLTKLAAEGEIFHIDVKDIFYENLVHPSVYLRALLSSLTEEFFAFDAKALIKIIEQTYGLTAPIEDIPLNKILSVQSINRSKTPFESSHAFEKIVRSFVEMPINWMNKESDDIGFENLAKALLAIELSCVRFSPYQEFTPEIISYAARIVVADGVKYFYPIHSTDHNQEYDSFYSQLNKAVEDEINRKDSYDTFDDKEIASIISNNEIVIECTKTILMKIRSEEQDPQIIDKVDKMVAELELDPETAEMTKSNIMQNIAMDQILSAEKERLDSQITLYNIK